MTLSSLFTSCPKEKRIEIGDYYCVPVRWVSPDSGKVESTPTWLASIGHGLFAEFSLTGKLGLIWTADNQDFTPAWSESKDEKILALKGMIDQLVKEIAS